jgi:hypothetical protein
VWHDSVPLWFKNVDTYITADIVDPMESAINIITGKWQKSLPQWFSAFPSLIEDIKTTALAVIQSIAFGGADALVNAINMATSLINNVIILPIDHILSWSNGSVSGPIPPIPKINLAGGGHVAGNLGENDTSDSMLAALTPGEFVLRKRAAAKLGPHALEWLNHADTNGASVLPFAQDGSKSFGRMSRFAGGGLVGSLVQDGVSFVQGSLKDAFDSLYSLVATPLLNSIGDTSIPGAISSMIGQGIKSFGDHELGASDAKVLASLGTIPVGAHLSILKAALSAAAVPSAQWSPWEAGLNTLITRESGWNASAINRTDSNAAAGDPSEGLAQTTGSTFAAYHVNGTSSNILDPVANVAAAIKYIEANYGSISNVQQANASKPPKGYALGGFAGDVTSGMGFASPSMHAMSSASHPGMSSVVSAGARAANGMSSGPGVHIENMNISNPIPEQSSDSLSRSMTKLRVFGGRG